MSSRRFVSAVVLLVTLGTTATSPAISAPPASRSRPRPAAPASVRSFDLLRRLDIGSLNFVVTNFGPLGYDIGQGAPGLLFPRGTTNSVLFASGLWLGGLVGGDQRLALSEYSSEFTPGNMIGGAPDDPNDPAYAVWKVLPWKGNPQDTTHVDRTPAELAADPTLDPVAHHSWAEYMANAAPHGAPVTDWILPGPGGVGTVLVQGPAVIGDQMLWCVYNDADPTAHNAFPGSTQPLGLEVQQSVFGFAAPGPARQSAFIRWKIVNKSNSTIESTRVAYWLDPDLGGPSDDFVGCDSAAALGFAYNATNNDDVYGPSPPALGVDLLNEEFDPTHLRSLGMHSFNKYFNGTDPASNVEAWNVLLGLQPNGGFILDPFTLLPTWYAVSGDPVLGTGWLDTVPADRRMILTRGPRTLAPGESMEVWAALTVAQGDSRLESVQLLKCWDLWVQNLYANGFGPAPPTPPDCGITQPAASCPRPVDFYAAECQGGPHLNPSQLEMLAAAIEGQSTLFSWPPGPDGAATFCSFLNDATDVRAQAKAEFATLLANALAQPVGIVPAGTTPIRLDLSAPVSIPGLSATNIFELIAPAGPNGLVADYHNLNVAHRTPIAGVNVWLESFGGGAGYGINFLGSSLDPLASPDSFHTVRVRFEASNPQKAYRYLRLELEGSGGIPPQGRAYLYGGFRDVPFEVIDESTGQRLDVAFVERTVVDEFGTILGPAFQPATFDSTWGPDESAAGGREYLLVTSRPYAGTPRAEFTYDGAFIDGLQPVTYALWCMRIAASDVFDDNDEFVFQNGLIPGPGADGLLTQLEGQPLSDPAVVLAYEQLRDGLGAINRGESLPSVCDDPTPAMASLVSALADPDRVRLEWSVDAAGSVTVERSAEADAWLPAGTVMADGSGRVRWEDTAVEPGKHYGYRLALGSGGGAPYAGEAWVEVPSAARLAIAGLAPNPGGPNASIVFSLAGSGRATIEMVDLAGRRVFSREVGAMGPGTHSLSLGGRMAPGVYWLRLTQGERSVKTRGVILQ